VKSKEGKMFVETAKIDEIVPGGMKAYEVKGKELVLCNYGGKIYAVSRRCGHTNAPLEMGTLEGYILTCPLHHSQFDITTGEVLSGPIPADFGEEPIPESLIKYFQYVSMLLSKIKTYDLETYPVKIDGNLIMVDVE
jgi:nitrite reductase/ring-hydroxylating ferredoxin subunit